MLAAPATATLTISGLINKVKSDLQNRSDVSEAAANPEMRPSAWIRDALRELSANYPFEELKVVGPMATIGPGLGYQGSNFSYPLSMFLNQGDDVTLMDDFVIFLTSTSAIQTGTIFQTTNQVGYPMDRLDMKAIQSLLFISGGVPFKYCRHGSLVYFGTQPGQPYNVYLPYQVRHQFNPDIVSTPIRLPQDWFDILSLAAAERGALKLRWNDQSNFIHTTLYGDPKSMIPGTGEMARPGLIAAKLFQEERDRMHSPIQVLPGAQRY